MAINVITRKYVIIAMLFTTTLILSQILTAIMLKIGPFVLPAAVFFFPIAYIFGDIFSEVYGYKGTRLIVVGGMIVQAVFFAVLAVVPDVVRWAQAHSLVSFLTEDMLNTIEKLFNFTFRISLASLVAYFVGENVNSIILSKMKILTKGRLLPVRTITSTLFGEFVDSLFFGFLALYGFLTLGQVFVFAVSQSAVKSLVEAVMTPVTIAVCNWLKKTEKIDIYDFGIAYNPLNTDVVYPEENNLWQGGGATK